MFILIDIFGREFEFGNTDPLVIYNTDGNPIDVNRDPIFQSQLMPDLYATLPLLKCGYTSETISSATPNDMNQYYSIEEQSRHGVIGFEMELI